MHEMSLAMRIVEIALDEAQAARARGINEIEVEVGTLAGVMAEALEFCLEAAARDTLAEKATFTLIQVPGQGHCLVCQRGVAIQEFPAQCPLCRGYGVTITGGIELKIRSITIVE